MAPPGIVGAAVALLLAGCARETYDVADLQVDVSAPLPATAETLRLCVSDHGTLERGAGNGRMAFPGIRAGEAVDVTINVYDEAGSLLGSAGPARVDGDAPWITTTLSEPEEPCVAGGAIAAEGAETWLLAVRFEE